MLKEEREERQRSEDNRKELRRLKKGEKRRKEELELQKIDEARRVKIELRRLELEKKKKIQIEAAIKRKQERDAKRLRLEKLNAIKLKDTQILSEINFQKREESL